jgi:hypothetical protein
LSSRWFSDVAIGHKSFISQEIVDIVGRFDIVGSALVGVVLVALIRCAESVCGRSGALDGHRVRNPGKQ